MKLLIINANWLERINAKYYSVFSWIQFPVRLAEQCETVTLLAPVIVRKQGIPSPDAWCVDVGKLNIEEQDYFKGFGGYYRFLPLRFLKLKTKVMRLIKEHDVVVLRIPNPMISLVTKSVLHQKKILVLILGGDITTASNRILTGCRLKRLIYSIALKFLSLQEKRCARCADVAYIYGNQIRRRLQLNEEDVRLMRDPHMSMDDFKYRNDTCQSGVVRLLRVCWLMPCKGIEYLLEAVAILVRAGLPVELEIVGKGDCPGYRESLEKVSEGFKISDRVIFAGWVPFNRMQDVYFRSHIQVISSVSEGIPRCIEEGAACGLPLVSTTAGGCVDALTHEVNALLVPPADAKLIADAVERIIKDEGLRKTLIKGGYEMASKFTFENAGMQFLDELNEKHLNRWNK